VPELPEVETVRARVSAALQDARFRSVRIHRPDIVRGDASPNALLQNQSLSETARHGKQLALIGSAGCCVSIHLGMSGRLEIAPTSAPLSPHTHLVWECDNDAQLRFVDPRRFGGIWTHPTREHLLSTRWDALGPDAAALTATQLARACRKRTAPIKAVLLDQNALAGVGNIYADEALHLARVSPFRPARDLSSPEHTQLARSVRQVLREAIRAGGSTIRDYRTPSGEAGGYATRHRVYGRAGQECRSCSEVLHGERLAGRATVYCPACQT